MRRWPLLLVTIAIVQFLIGSASAFQTSAPSPSSSVTEEVVGRILRAPIGGGTHADFNYPDDYVRRIADRVVRASFEQRFRMVVADYRPTTRPVGPPLSELVGHNEDQTPKLILILSIGAAVMIATGIAARRLSRRARR